MMKYSKIKSGFVAVAMFTVVITATSLKPAYSQELPQNGTSADYEIPELPFGEYLSGRHALYNKQYDQAAENYLKALELDPDNVNLNHLVLSILVADGQFEEAIKVAHKLKELDEEIDQSRLVLFFENVKSKNLEQAQSDVEGLASSGILNLIKPFFRAWILAEQGEHEQIEEIIAGFEDGTTFNFFNFFQSGLLHEYLGNDELAEQYYSRALSERGMLNLRAVEAYGAILMKQGKQERSIEVFKEYLADAQTNEQLKLGLSRAQAGEVITPLVSNLDQAYSELFYAVATILMQDNVKRVATNFLQYAVYFENNFPLAHFMQAQIYESDKYYSGANRELNKIPADNPLYFQSKIQRAWILNDMDDEEGALSAFKALDNEYPNNRNVLNSIAELYRTHERYAEAIPAYDRVVDIIEEETSRDWVLFYTRGIVYDQEKRWPEAEENFKKALELRPEQPMVLNYLAYSWVDQGKNYVEAKKMLERAVELRPNDGYIVDSLGWALFKMGQEDEAVGVLERAAQLQTQDWAINDHLGDVYWTVGRKNEARFQWRHALSLSPDADKVDGIKDKIKNGFNGIK